MTYVYSVAKYEEASFSLNGPLDPEKIKDFWDSGVLLSEWEEKCRNDSTIDSKKWEVIVAPENIVNSRKMMNREIIMNAPEDRVDEVFALLEPRMYAMGMEIS